jgi:hypothetical protein
VEYDWILVIFLPTFVCEGECSCVCLPVCVHVFVCTFMSGDNLHARLCLCMYMYMCMCRCMCIVKASNVSQTSIVPSSVFEPYYLTFVTQVAYYH